MFDGLLATTVIGKAIAAGIVAVHRTNPRDFGLGKLPAGRRHALRRRARDDHARRADRGGAGRDRGGARALAPHPADAARAALRPGAARARWRRGRASRWSAGATRAIDERVRSLVDDQLCIGDFVLAGGELAAAVVLEATARLVPGRARLRAVRRRRVVLGRPPRVPAVDPPRRVAGPGGARGAARRATTGDRALAPARRRCADRAPRPDLARGPPAHRRGAGLLDQDEPHDEPADLMRRTTCRT